jgi:hypothetical protein
MLSKMDRKQSQTLATSRREYEAKLRDYRQFLRSDADYDSHFIIRLLRYKLQRTRDHLLEHNISMDAKKCAKEIKAVVDLLLRIENDVYHDELFRPFYKKYGRPRFIRQKGSDKNGSVGFLIKYAKETDRNRSAIRRESHRIMMKIDTLRQRDLNKALFLISKNIWKWWD